MNGLKRVNESAVYNELWKRSRAAFTQGACELDPLIAHEENLRKGLTLLARIPSGMSSKIEEFIAELKAQEPRQYFQPVTDFHLTVLSVVSCSAGFRYDPELLDAYRRVISDCLADVPPLEIQFRGITASPACVMIQGFALNDSLKIIRNRLRESMPKSGLPCSIDRRYAIQTAHMTVMRFRQDPEDLTALLRFLESERAREFGTVRIDALEFVSNDWYQRARNTELVGNYSLNR